MKPIKKIEAEVLKIYHAYWDGYLKGNMEEMSSYMDTQIQMIGSGRGEVFYNKKDTTHYYQSTAGQVSAKSEIRNRNIKTKLVGSQILVTETNDFFVLMKDVWTFYGEGRISTLFTETKNGWKIIQQHGSLPDSRTGGGEQVNIDKIKVENIRLKEAVKRRNLELEEKNRELEIEAALERLRSRMLSMKKSSELEETTAVMYRQLDALGVVPEGAMVYIVIIDVNTETAVQWIVTDGTLVESELRTPLTEDPRLIKTYEGWKRKDPLLIRDLSGDELEDFKNYLKTLHSFQENTAEIDRWPDRMVWSEASFSQGTLGFIYSTPLPQATLDILVRFALDFDLVYTRFLDLQKAEEQAREAQIEVALERVRTRTMTMRKSEELADVIEIVFNEVQQLDFKLKACDLIIIDKETGNSDLWISGELGNKAIHVVTSNIKHKHYQNSLQAWKSNQTVRHTELKGKNCNSYMQLLIDSCIEGIIPNDVKEFILQIDKVIHTDAYMEFGYLRVASLDFLHKEEESILLRFAKVFEQTYTRFLDLEKAEAQAREAQIEAALERVRSRTMAMQKSDELRQVVFEYYKQIHPFGFAEWGFEIKLAKEDNSGFYCWISPPGARIQPQYFDIPTLDHWVLKKYWSVYEQKQPVVSIEVSGDDKSRLGHLLLNKSDMKYLPEEVKTNIRETDYVHFSVASMKFGLLKAVDTEPQGIDKIKILQRFAEVFEQTYTRFLDLQKAEAQAREAQIEAALERVRSRIMAMQRSEEIIDCLRKIFDELSTLDVLLQRIAIWTFNEKEKYTTWWSANSEAITKVESYKIDYVDIPVFQSFLEAWHKRDPLFLYTLSGDEKDAWEDHLFTNTGLSKLPKEVQKGMRSEGTIFLSSVISTYGLLMAGSLAPLPDEYIDILKRFSHVFEQSYTRFLDIQKAEAQAREAQIEAALERIRSRSMAMQSSEELMEVVKVMYDQVEKLGIAKWGCMLLIFDKVKQNVQGWFSEIVKAEYTKPFDFDNKDHEVIRSWWNFWESEEEIMSIYLKDEEKHDFTRYLFTKTGMKVIPDEVKKVIMNEPEVYFEFVNMGCGIIEFVDIVPFPKESIPVLKRITAAFEQAYIRFLDIQKAEAQAREAQIEASLERIRGQALAMHESSDLLDIVVTMHTEFTKLGFNPGYFWHMLWTPNEYLKAMTSGDGSKIGMVMELPRHFSGNQDIYDWEMSDESVGVFKLNVDSAIDYVQKMVEKGNFLQVDPNAPSPEDIREVDGITFIMARTTHGEIGYSLYGQTDPTIEELKVLARFVAVFDLAYRRFEDLKQAEANIREAQIEAAMERIRSAAIAMRSSKELKNVIVELRRQIDSLGQLDLEASVIHLYTKDSPTFESIAAVRPPGESGDIVLANVLFPVDATPEIEHMMKMYESEVSDYTIEFDKEKAESWQKAMMIHAPMIAERREGFVESTKIGEWNEYWNFSDFSEGSLLLVTHSPASEDTKDVLKKAAQVFDLAYQRYQDLVKAEERAREAVRQTSIDRVRGEIASMRSTEDLQRITPLVWNELKTLGVPFIRCGVFIMDENTQTVHTYLSSPDGRSLGTLNLSFDSDEHTSQSVEAWRENRVYLQHWTREDFVKWSQSMKDKGQIQNLESYQGEESPPDSLDLHFIPFTQGMMYVGSINPLNEDEIDLVKSLAKAFSIAYARYEDFVKLEIAKQNVESTLTELKSTQTQLIQSEKMASLGELTAGIAHEIQNPLNFVNNFSEVNSELIEEMKEELGGGEIEEALEIANDILQNNVKIIHHGKRADGIVKGMLEHSRTNSGDRIFTDLNALADEYFRLAYHGLRAKDKSFNAEMIIDLDPDLPKIKVIPQDIGRVILNLVNNAFQAVDDKKKNSNSDYNPKVILMSKTTSESNDAQKAELRISDNGEGIPQEIIDKIFQPFFTTKPTGQGTGLGLSLSYDIIKAHGGKIDVETEESKGTTFIIQLPIK